MVFERGFFLPGLRHKIKSLSHNSTDKNSCDQATITKNSNHETMKFQQHFPTINEEVNLNTYGNEDSKAVVGPGDDAIVNVESGDAPGDESLTKVCA
jgi:hypothetical protein